MTEESKGETDPVGEVATAADEDLDVEMALLAMTAASDMGGPMRELDLNTLSSAEKRLLLAMMRQRFGGEGGGNAVAEADLPSPDYEAEETP